MNNQWRACHLPFASKFLLRKMILVVYVTLNPELTHSEQVEKMNILATIDNKDALIAEGRQVLALLERRKMCCLSLPEVPHYPLHMFKERGRRLE